MFPTHCTTRYPHLSGLLLGSLLTTLPLAATQAQTTDNRYCDQFDSVQAAIVAAGNYYNPLSISEDRQYIGTVLQHTTDNHYIFTAVAGKPGQDKVSSALTIPEGYRLAAFWQTRGDQHWGQQYFSREQTHLARQWQLPYYMTNASGYLKVYAPDDPLMSSIQVRRRGLGMLGGVAEGQEIRVQEQPLQVATRMDEWQAQLAATAAGPDTSGQTDLEKTAAIGPACMEDTQGLTAVKVK